MPIGWSTEYGIWDGTEFVPLNGVFRLNPPTVSSSRQDITTLCDVGKRRYARARPDVSDPSLEMNYNPGSTDDLLILSLLSSGEARRHRILLPLVTGAISRRFASFDAVVSGYEPAIPLDDRLTAVVSLIPASSEVIWGTAGGALSLILEPGIVEDGIVE